MLCALGATLALLAVPCFAAAETIVVNSTGDSGSPFDPCNGGEDCTLREAIERADTEPGADRITFSGLPSGYHLLVVESPLPAITEGLTIDGDTELTGPTGVPEIELDPASAAASGAGLTIVGTRNTSIEYLAIGGFTTGIRVEPEEGENPLETRICGNYIGTELNGEVAKPNEIGIAVAGVGPGEQSEKTVIGGAGCAANRIGGNSLQGIYDAGLETTIQGDKIGIGVGGASLPNGTAGNAESAGVYESEVASGALIGGTEPSGEEGNLIVGNDGAGALVESSASQATIRRDSISGNEGKGIEILTDDQPAPTIAVAEPEVEGKLFVEGTVTGATPGEIVSLEFFGNSVCGNGEGQTVLGGGELEITAAGSNHYAFQLQTRVPFAESAITATSTREAGATTEFSACGDYQHGPLFVNTLEDSFDPGGECVSTCSLRDAIELANLTPAKDTIEFSVEGKIEPASRLPVIEAPLEILGTSAPGYTGAPVLEISGALAGTEPGLTTRSAASGSTFTGLAIDGFDTGILLEGSENKVCGSYLGVKADGTAGLADEIGIEVAPLSEADRIGAACELIGDGNLISGNSEEGIYDYGAETQIADNGIGVGPSGSAVPNGSGNASDGGIVIGFGSSHSLIGQVNAEPANVIADNLGAGVLVGRASSAAQIRANSIYGNEARGIEIALEPPTPPTIESVTLGSTTMTIEGAVTAGAEAEPVELDFFASAACGPPQGQTFLGSDVVDSPGGTTHYEAELSAELPGGQEYVTATSTGEAVGQTSEFSTCFKYQPPARTLTVNTLEDVSDPGACTDTCSLRDAIEIADSTAVEDTIDFSEFAEGTIGPDGTQLPAITEPVTIDGTSAPGYDGEPVVMIDGAEAATEGTTNGLEVIGAGSGSTIRGLAIGGFGRGVDLEGVSGTRLCSNWIGVELDGVTKLPNGTGVEVEDGSADTVIGDGGSCPGNVISGNSEAGIFDGGTHTVIESNLIGVGPGGTEPLANGSITLQAPGVVVGTTAVRSRVGQNLTEEPAGNGNTIAHNAGPGILVETGAAETSIRRSRIFANEGGTVEFQTPSPVPSYELEAVIAPPTETTYRVHLNGALADTTYEFDVFANAKCAAANRGPAEVFLASGEVTTDGSGEALAEIHGGPLAGIDAEAFTVTTTEASTGTTSQLSLCGKTPPVTEIESGPPSQSNSPNATFTFSGTDFGQVAGFECNLDGAAFSTCTSPQEYTGLASGAHTFEVRAVDAEGFADPTPAGYSWSISTEPPEVTITAGPSGATNATTATFEFTATETGSPVTAVECSLDGAEFTACTSPQEYADLAPGSHTFEVKATDEVGNTSAPVSRTWTVDTEPPEVTITDGPRPKTNATTAKFEFTATDAGSAVTAIQCRLDAAEFSPCEESEEYTDLAPGPHTFEVKATDAAGNTSAPVSYSWTVVTEGPVVTITAGPPARTNSTSATFEFTATDSGAPVTGYECRVGAEAFGPCSSPVGYTGLAPGSHTFEVRATDEAGNTSGSASRTWTVDTEPPSSSITAAPPASTESTGATFEFSATDSGSAVTGYECSLDAGSFAPCASPAQFSGLAPGPHSFAVRATDEAGNSGEPTVYRWTVAAPPRQQPPTQQQSTAPPAEEPAPTNGEKVVVAPEEGKVLIKLPGSKKFVPLEELKEIPVGAVIDATKGKVKLTSIDPDGTEQSADFFGGVFKVKQREGAGLVVLELLDTTACPAPTPRVGPAPIPRVAPRLGGAFSGLLSFRPGNGSSGKLWGSGHGNFRTEGNNGSATVRGTIWLVEDRCNGTTFFRTRRGIVSVKDFVTGKTFPLPAGNRYVAGEG